MEISQIFLVLYDCPNIFERVLGRTCYLSDLEEFYAHAFIAGMLLLLLTITLFVLRHQRIKKYGSEQF